MKTASDYASFLRAKQDLGHSDGFEPIEIPDFLFGFQRSLVDWAIRKGRAAIFADCLAGESVINSPDGDIAAAAAFQRQKPLRVFSIDFGRVVIAKASTPFIGGVDDLYRFTLSSGREIVATMGHRFLTASGWKSGIDLKVGECLLVSDASRLRSIWESGQSTRPEDDPHCNRTIPGCWDHCSDDSYPYDERLPALSDIVLAPAPSRSGVHGRTQLSCIAGGSENVSSRNRHRPSIVQSVDRESVSRLASFVPHTDRLSTVRSSRQAGTIEGVAKFRLPSSDRTSTAENIHISRRALEDTILARQARESHPSEAQWSEGDRYEASDSPLVWFDTLVAVHYIRTDVFYDMQVPGPANYLASNIFSHNCGLGKTPMQLCWADNVVRKSGKPVLILTPLAVSAQTVREAEKFGFPAKQSRTGEVVAPITVTNYEQLHRFNDTDFIGCVCDESGMIKAFNGKRRKQVVRFMSKLPYRLLCSATPSPNDFIELGTQSEALGVMTQSDMLGYFFREAKYMRHTVFRDGDFWNYCKYYFKPHSEQPFWRWITSWARALKRPSDIGFEDGGFELPPLEYGHHIVETRYIPPGELFPRPANTIHEQQAERNITVAERCEKVAELIDGHSPAIAWCHLNEEGIHLTKIIPGAVEVAGRHSDEHKEAVLNDFALGNISVLVSKPKIACWGMNYQICGYMTLFPTYSFEQVYQCVRRCWRFGRVGPVQVDIVSSPGEAHVIDGLQVKMAQEERMFTSLVKFMHDAEAMYSEDRHHTPLELPAWVAERTEADVDPVPVPIARAPKPKQRRNGKASKPVAIGNKALVLPTWLKSSQP